MSQLRGSHYFNNQNVTIFMKTYLTSLEKFLFFFSPVKVEVQCYNNDHILGILPNSVPYNF